LEIKERKNIVTEKTKPKTNTVAIAEIRFNHPKTHTKI